jgi:ABC-2 type transport system permease protein
MTAIEQPAPAGSRRPSTYRTSTGAATIGLARRSVRNIVRLPSAFLPSVLMPIVQAIAFSGTFFAIVQIPGFPTDRSINWFLPLAVIMGSGFAGIGIGFATIRDLENGFYDRLRLTPAPRRALITGPLASALARAVLVTSTVLVVGTVFGARLTHGPVGLLPLYVASIGVALMGTGWGLGLAYRFRDMRAAAIMQLTFFLCVFLTDAQTPLGVMEGWLETVARVNPFTNVTRLARLGYLDADPSWGDAWGGVVTCAVLGALTLWFARRGLESLGDR